MLIEANELDITKHAATHSTVRNVQQHCHCELRHNNGFVRSVMCQYMDYLTFNTFIHKSQYNSIHFQYSIPCKTIQENYLFSSVIKFKFHKVDIM